MQKTGKRGLNTFFSLFRPTFYGNKATTLLPACLPVCSSIWTPWLSSAKSDRREVLQRKCSTNSVKSQQKPTEQCLGRENHKVRPAHIHSTHWSAPHCTHARQAMGPGPAGHAAHLPPQQLGWRMMLRREDNPRIQIFFPSSFWSPILGLLLVATPLAKVELHSPGGWQEPAAISTSMGS